MKAFLIDRYGKNAGRIGEVPVPEVGAHDVLIEVHASSVNLLDSINGRGVEVRRAGTSQGQGRCYAQMTTPHIDALTVEAEQLSLPQPSSSEVTSPESRKQQELQPHVVFVEPPVIVWRSLMLEQ
ncbi:hypothetical protein QFZ85_001884 [Pseudomonas frederiksbergensis]